MIGLESSLKNKKILFFSIQTFNLQIHIKNKLEEFGAEVFYFDERPTNNNLVKGILRVNRKLLIKSTNKYYNNILKSIYDINFDYLFVIRGEVIPPFFLEKIRIKNQKCKFIYYNWDSFSNLPNPISILKYFDKCFSFDPFDSDKFNLLFRPLFYLDSFKKNNSFPIKFDILFLGTAHSDRYFVSEFVNSWAKENNLNSFFYYYIQNRIVYLYKFIFDKSFKKFDFKKLNFNSLSIEEIVSLYNSSNVILDINHPNQKGLTMRTFEALGSQKKLITTNSEIFRYSFFNKNNIQVIDRNNIKLNLDFFNTKYKEIPDSVYSKFSLSYWIYNIFIDEENVYWNSFIKNKKN